MPFYKYNMYILNQFIRKVTSCDSGFRGSSETPLWNSKDNVHYLRVSIPAVP